MIAKNRELKDADIDGIPPYYIDPSGNNYVREARHKDVGSKFLKTIVKKSYQVTLASTMVSQQSVTFAHNLGFKPWADVSAVYRDLTTGADIPVDIGDAGPVKTSYAVAREVTNKDITINYYQVGYGGRGSLIKFTVYFKQLVNS